MDACGRGVFALFNVKLIALHVEAPYPFLTYMRTRISVLSECNSVAHMLDNVMYWRVTHSTPYDASKVRRIFTRRGVKMCTWISTGC